MRSFLLSSQPAGLRSPEPGRAPAGIVPEAAPRLVFAIERQSALHRIAVHITQFLYSLLLAEDHTQLAFRGSVCERSWRIR
jgi:hypothetical protein